MKIAFALIIFICTHLQANAIDKVGIDVQTLSASLSDYYGQAGVDRIARIQVDLRNCVRGDCTQELQRVLAENSVNGILATQLLVTSFQENGRLVSRTLYGNLVRIKIVLKKAAYESPTFTGIGLYSTNGNSLVENKLATNTLITKSRIEEYRRINQGEVFLSNGEAAYEINLVTIMPDIVGNSATGSSRGLVEFKPYAQYSAQQIVYNVWEDVLGNFKIYRSNAEGRITSFERQYILSGTTSCANSH